MVQEVARVTLCPALNSLRRQEDTSILWKTAIAKQIANLLNKAAPIRRGL
jgi:hypothetical protein